MEVAMPVPWPELRLYMESLVDETWAEIGTTSTAPCGEKYIVYRWKCVGPKHERRKHLSDAFKHWAIAHVARARGESALNDKPEGEPVPPIPDPVYVRLYWRRVPDFAEYDGASYATARLVLETLKS